MKKWNVHFCLGLGPLRLGMTAAEVADLDGEIGSVIATHEMFGIKTEHRPHYTPKCDYISDRLVSIDARRTTEFEINIGDASIFSQDAPEVLRLLESLNGGAKTDGSSVLFDRIGINTGGFFFPTDGTYFNTTSGQQDDRTLAVFKEGLFDKRIKDIVQLAS